MFLHVNSIMTEPHALFLVHVLHTRKSFRKVGNKKITVNFGGHAVVHLVEALQYKPEVRGFDFRWCHWNFFFEIILPAALMALGLTQPLIEMRTRNISCGIKVAGA
jgi:hypothetical protein